MCTCSSFPFSSQFPIIVDNSPLLLETFGNIPVLKHITQSVRPWALVLLQEIG